MYQTEHDQQEFLHHPKTAVAAKVVALVTGIAKEIGVSLRMAKNVADADKFRTNGKEYCHINFSLNQFLRVVMILCWGVFGCGNDLMASSHLIAPFRIKAFVAPKQALLSPSSPLLLPSEL
ncbi:hypothetical protein H5410_043545 [Solanum commersonii]|uniref:Uncharacterized protein n=1 Tax=Solanum commersonii TaxID=4109 RepID=A0A9J5XZI7_SOLCO|nr:hypothetical protein H5410_043545 [Solanum commersonii]